jgi:multidrug efflux system outer membrane protein
MNPRSAFRAVYTENEIANDNPAHPHASRGARSYGVSRAMRCVATGRVRARIGARRADGDAQLAQYQQSVLLALEDVENALVMYARSQDRDAQLQLAAKDSKRAADLASIRFRNGATGLLDLLDAQRAQLKDEDAYAEAIPTSLSPLFCCTSRLLGDGLNVLLNRRKA